MTKLKLITGEKAILAAAIASAKAVKSSAMDVHIVLCSALAHVRDHGNTVVLERVYEKLHQSMNIRGIGAFIRKFTNLRAMAELDEKTGEETGKVLFRKPGKKPIAIQLDDAMATPYWEMPANARGNTALWDMEKRFLSLLGQARFHLGKEDVTDKAKAETMVKALEQVAKEYKLDTSGIPSVADGKAAKGTTKTASDVGSDTKSADKPKRATNVKRKTAAQDKPANDANVPQEKAA